MAESDMVRVTFSFLQRALSVLSEEMSSHRGICGLAEYGGAAAISTFSIMCRCWLPNRDGIWEAGGNCHKLL